MKHYLTLALGVTMPENSNPLRVVNQSNKPQQPASDRIVEKFLNGDLTEQQYREAVRQETQRRINDRKKGSVDNNGANAR